MSKNDFKIPKNGEITKPIGTDVIVIRSRDGARRYFTTSFFLRARVPPSSSSYTCCRHVEQIPDVQMRILEIPTTTTFRADCPRARYTPPLAGRRLRSLQRGDRRRRQQLAPGGGGGDVARNYTGGGYVSSPNEYRNYFGRIHGGANSSDAVGGCVRVRLSDRTSVSMTS